MDIKPGDVLFVWGRSLIDDAIELVTHGPSHCALFVSQTKIEEAQGGRTVGECDLSFYLHQNARLEVWGDDTLTDDERAEMVQFAHTLYGENYDYVLIPLEFLHAELGLPLGWYHNNDELICSGDVNKVAQHVGGHWTDEPNPSPADLWRGGVLKKKGDLPTVTQMAG